MVLASHPAHKMHRQKGLQLLLLAYILLLGILLLEAQRAGKPLDRKSIYQEDCLNISIPEWKQAFLEPCVKLWSRVNCKGTYIRQKDIGMARSAGECSACQRRNRTGLRCAGPQRNRRCLKVPSICDGRSEPLINGTEIEISESGNEFEVRNVPITIEPIDIRNFKVFHPLTLEEKEEGPSIPFILYRRSDPNQAIDAETVEFKIDDKVLIYIHGYATIMLVDGINIKNAVFEGTSDVDAVILVDWRKWSLPLEERNPNDPPNYKIVALVNVPIVAEHLSHFLITFLHNDNYIYLVGFSLGGHVAGTAARELAKVDGPIVDRISALDPAGPIFESTLNGAYPLDTGSTLRVSDARLVDVIHCSTVLGMKNPAGHLDTYLEENDCVLPYCAHRKAIQMYISSLKRCSLITCPKSGEACTPSTVSAYGYLSDLYPGRGNYTLSLIRHWSSDAECSEFMNVYLPAKHRVCLEPPKGINDCYGYPYLTECAVDCPNQTVNKRSVCSPNVNVRLEYNDGGKNNVQNSKFARNPDKVKWHGGNCTR